MDCSFFFFWMSLRRYQRRRQQGPLPRPHTGVQWNHLGVCPSVQPPPAASWRLNLQHPQSTGARSVWLQQGRAARKGSPTRAMGGASFDKPRLSPLLSCRQQCVTFLMPGFYGWMSDSVRKISPFPESQAEAVKSTAKSGEHLQRTAVEPYRKFTRKHLAAGKVAHIRPAVYLHSQESFHLFL